MMQKVKGHTRPKIIWRPGGGTFLSLGLSSFSSYLQACPQGSTPVFRLLSGPKMGFSPHVAPTNVHIYHVYQRRSVGLQPQSQRN